MSDITPEEQAKRLQALRQQAPLPAPSDHLLALRQAFGGPASGASAVPGPAQTADTTAPPAATTTATPARREQAPVRGRDLPFSSNPAPEIETQSLARALEADRLLAAGIDPWSPLVSPEDAVHAFHAGKIDPAAEQSPLPLPEALRPALQQAKALRKAAQAKVDDALRPLARAEADIALLQNDLAVAKDLSETIRDHHVAQIAAGRPAELDAKLKRRVADRDAAQRRLDATRSALGPLQKAVDAAITEHAKAQAGVEHVVIQMVAAKGNAIAIECIAARERYTELQSQLLNLGAVRLGGMGPKFSNDCWLVMNDEPAKPVLHNDLVLEWLRAARELMEDGTDV